MPETSTIRENLKRLRVERGLSQEGLAEKSGLSKATIAKLEQGRRQGERTTTLMRLANALDVELGELVGKRERLGEDRDGASVLAVRDAILSPSLLPGLPGLDAEDHGDPTPLPDLTAAVTTAWEAYWAGEFGKVAAAVPGLITEARLTHRSLGPAAAAPLAQAYQLGACLMVHFGRDDLAAIGAERGIVAAAEGDDEWQWATVQGTYAWVLHHQARLAEAEDLAMRVAEQIEPSFSAPDEHLAAWGNLLMTALAPACAAGKDPKDYVSKAAAAAERIGHRVDVYQTGFGPATVAMQAVHAYAVLKKPGQALKAAKNVRVGNLRGISRARHLLDVARAHVDAGQPRAAETTLAEARAMSRVWFRHQGLARTLAAEVREIQTRPSPVIRAMCRDLGIE
ncbi:helix-turn-helix transcriptional regulator [Actinomadura keratinilytica]|uniref:Helix-turn-helix domain-containing protein n=1 Tax=Actinomadura keratinilytica TaxID=547461 RepID=A0ABP7YGN7_9ACTN